MDHKDKIITIITSDAKMNTAEKRIIENRLRSECGFMVDDVSEGLHLVLPLACDRFIRVHFDEDIPIKFGGIAVYDFDAARIAYLDRNFDGIEIFQSPILSIGFNDYFMIFDPKKSWLQILQRMLFSRHSIDSIVEATKHIVKAFNSRASTLCALEPASEWRRLFSANQRLRALAGLLLATGANRTETESLLHREIELSRAPSQNVASDERLPDSILMENRSADLMNKFVVMVLKRISEG